MARPSAKSNGHDPQYIAGVLDSSGVIFSAARPLHQTPSKSWIEELVEDWGGTLTTVYGRKRLQYAWNMNNEEIVELLKVVGPWMVRHRAKAYRYLIQNEVKPDFEPDENPYI